MAATAQDLTAPGLLQLQTKCIHKIFIQRATNEYTGERTKITKLHVVDIAKAPSHLSN